MWDYFGESLYTRDRDIGVWLYTKPLFFQNKQLPALTRLHAKLTTADSFQSSLRNEASKRLSGNTEDWMATKDKTVTHRDNFGWISSGGESTMHNDLKDWIPKKLLKTIYFRGYMTPLRTLSTSEMQNSKTTAHMAELRKAKLSARVLSDLVQKQVLMQKNPDG